MASGWTAIIQPLIELDRLPVNPLTVGDHTLVWGARTYIMGILNFTPDSFSGDGLLSGGDTLAAARELAGRFLKAGADLLDIGGESTRPGSEPVSAEEELARVLPAIRALAADFPGALLSIDTYKAAVAEQALRSGARMVNEVWGLRADPDLAGVVARANAPVVLMHNRSKPANAQVRERLGGRYIGMEYTHLLQEVQDELLASVRLAHAAGIPDEHILLDPGIGFGKTVEQNLELLNRLGELRALGYPLLIGPSRKSFIGYTLDLPPGERLEGTAAAVAVGITRGADIVRLHDVESMARVVRMTDAIVRPLRGGDEQRQR